MYKKIESGTVSESDFLNAFNQTLAINKKNAKETKEYWTTIKTGLASKMWEKRMENLKEFRGVIKGLDAPDEILSFLRNVENELYECIIDLRSQIVKEACICVSYLSVKLGLRFEASAEPLVTALMNLIPNGVKVMSSSGRTALKMIYEHTQSRRLISRLCITFTSSRSNVVRQFCSALLCLICEKWLSNKCLENGMTNILDTLKKGLCDSDVEVRSRTRKAFFFFHKRFNNQAEKVMLSLEVSKRCQLQKELFSMSEEIKEVHLSQIQTNESTSNIPALSFTTSRMHSSPKETISDKSLVCSSPSQFLQDMLTKLQSRHYKERKESLENIGVFLENHSLSDIEIKSLIESFNDFFVENDSEVLNVFLSSLQKFIKVSLDKLLWWMKDLLVKLLSLKVGIHGLLTSNQVDDILHFMLLHNAGCLFESCCHIVLSKTLSPPLSRYVCELMLRVLNETSSKVLECSSPLLMPVITVLLGWTGDKRHPILKKMSSELLLKLSLVDQAQVKLILSSFPNHQQSRAYASLKCSNSPSRIPTSPSMSSSIAARESLRFSRKFILTNSLESDTLSPSKLRKSPSFIYTKEMHVKHGILTCHDLNLLEYPVSLSNNNDHFAAKDNDSSKTQYEQDLVVSIRDKLPETTVDNERSEVISSESVCISLSQLISALSSEEDIKTICSSLRSISLKLSQVSLQYINDHLSLLCSSLVKLVNHPNSSVRKHAITCLVSIYSHVGEQMWCFIALDKCKRALFDIYNHKG